jgi:hypothetical protein
LIKSRTSCKIVAREGSIHLRYIEELLECEDSRRTEIYNSVSARRTGKKRNPSEQAKSETRS